ncbi:MAG: hypothetical protein ACE15F_04705 [bacterium]
MPANPPIRTGEWTQGGLEILEGRMDRVGRTDPVDPVDLGDLGDLGDLADPWEGWIIPMFLAISNGKGR